MSGWVGAPLLEKIREDRALVSLDAAVSGYESELGEIIVAEMDVQRRSDRDNAMVIRSR